MIPNETIGEALRRAEAVLVAKRDEARRGDTMPLPREMQPGFVAAACGRGRKRIAPTPSALMSLIPVGEVSVNR